MVCLREYYRMNTSKLTVVAAALVATGCGTTMNKSAAMMETYRIELARTAALPGLSPGSAEERAAVQRFIELYKVYTADAIRAGVRGVYGDDGYFADPFAGHRGIDAIENYFLKSTEAIEECTFEVEPPAVKDGDYYFRWLMKLRIKRNPKERIEALGMSHVRFGADGKVVFQQDYWDTGLLMEKIPVLGWGVLKVRNSLD
jgi:hypothetical protein